MLTYTLLIFAAVNPSFCFELPSTLHHYRNLQTTVTCSAKESYEFN